MSDSEDELIVGFSNDSSRARLLPHRESEGFEHELQPFVYDLQNEDVTFERGSPEEVELDNQQGE